MNQGPYCWANYDISSDPKPIIYRNLYESAQGKS